ncbi:MAG: hypothetical protein RMH97_03555 [Verrucomicrobiales bacterium]|nr:hypothetical protein [Verrucomicrobiales bacterium]
MIARECCECFQLSFRTISVGTSASGSDPVYPPLTSWLCINLYRVTRYENARYGGASFSNRALSRGFIPGDADSEARAGQFERFGDVDLKPAWLLRSIGAINKP